MRLKTKEAIEDWLNQYDIKNYTINEDLNVDVYGIVDLIGKNLKEIPVNFSIVIGNFDCSINKLNSLEGSPKKVTGYFNCSSNNLISLEFCPKEIGGDFICSNNMLTSLKFCPEKIEGIFDCCNNELTSLKYCPKKRNNVCI
ncbi:hypothetical protein GW796_06655 [archaeon]|nr:hypothetical protein [archaeon]